MDGERWVTRDSSASGSRVCPERRRMRKDMGLRRLSLDFRFCGCAVGIEGFGVLDSFSLRPLISDVADLELAA